MNIRQSILVLLAGSLSLTACTSFDRDTQAQQRDRSGVNVVDIMASDRTSVSDISDQSGDTDSFGAIGQPQLYSSVQGAYKGKPLNKHVGDYVKNLAQDLIANMEYVSDKTPVGVTHFALLDSDLQHTDLLGRQMAESFMHELHKFRIPVIDFKATDYIRISGDGDFVLSRDYLELNGSLPIEYVLTGTMTKHQGGVLVNARIVGMESRAVVASAQTLVPFYVVDALIPSDNNQRNGMRDGVKLSKG